MTIASRTPEGEPLRCVVCGLEAAVEPSYPGGDSLDLVELTIEFEEEFEISISDDAAERIKTIGDVIRYIREAKKR